MSKKIKKINAAILIIGNEVLSGRTQDKNVIFISNWLNSKCGISVKEVRIIPDEEKIIVNNILFLSKKFDYVFTTGGIGPTHDDITSECIASAFGVNLPINLKAKKLLENYYKLQNIKLNNARLRMARIPTGSNLIKNPISAAPGFQIENVFVLAGVPNIFKSMVENIIKKLGNENSIKSKTIKINKAEGEIAEKLSNIASQFQTVSIGSYPFEKGEIKGTRIVITHHDKKIIKKVGILIKKLK